MRTYAVALIATAIGCLAPTIAPAAPFLLRCSLTREVSNPVAGAHISFRLVRYLKVDPDAGQVAEADEFGKGWRSLCASADTRCSLGESGISIAVAREHYHATTSIDRRTLRYDSETDNDVILSSTYGRCD